MTWFPNIKVLGGQAKEMEEYRLDRIEDSISDLRVSIESLKAQPKELERDIDDIGSSIEFIEAKTRSIENSMRYLDSLNTDTWNKIQRLIDYLGLEEVESIAKQEIRLVPKKKAAKRRKRNDLSRRS